MNSALVGDGGSAAGGMGGAGGRWGRDGSKGTAGGAGGGGALSGWKDNPGWKDNRTDAGPGPGPRSRWREDEREAPTRGVGRPAGAPGWSAGSSVGAGDFKQQGWSRGPPRDPVRIAGDHRWGGHSEDPMGGEQTLKPLP
jgi:hypothetical protein